MTKKIQILKMSFSHHIHPRMHHTMVIKTPPNIHESRVTGPSDKPCCRAEQESGGAKAPASPGSPPSCGCIKALFPPSGQGGHLLTCAVILLTLWAVSYCVLGQVALPGQLLYQCCHE